MIKIAVLSVIAAAALAGATFVQTGRASSPGLVAAYSFDEGTGTSVSDASGSGNGGTITGATWSTAGKFGRALVFDGSKARVDVPNSTSLQLSSAMTVEAWVKPAQISSAWRDVVYKGTDNYSLAATTDRSSKAAGSAMIGTGKQRAFSPNPLATNTWSHLAVTYDGSNLSLYVNGGRVSRKKVSGTIERSSNPLQIGGDSIYGQNFAGAIDEVRIYNTALSASAIQNDMNMPLGGTSAPSAPDTSAPSVPTGLSTSAVGEASATLSWTASSDNVGVAGYRIFRDGSQVGASASTTFAISGLSCDSSYTLGVAALDAAGNVSATATTGLTTAACPDTSAPSTPTGLTASAVGQTSATLSWTASSDNVGVAGYRIFRNGSQVGTAAGTTYTVTGLLCATSYTFGVAALDAAGNVSGTATKSVSTPACVDTTPPSTPTGLTSSGTGQTSVALSWNGSTDDYGVTGYRLYQNGSQVGASSSVGYIFGGLTCATTYTFGVVAVDGAGNVSTIATIALTTATCADMTAPSAPSGLTKSNVGQTNGTLTWTASTDNVGVAGYRLYRNGTQVGTATSTTYTFSGLTCGTSYSLGVAAVDGAGNVSAVASVSVSTLGCADAVAPSTPVGLSVGGVGQSGASLLWSPSSDNVGVTGYRLYRNGSQVGTATSTTYAYSGLSCGTGYSLGVAAVDGAGNVSGVASLSVTTAACLGGGPVPGAANVFVSLAGNDLCTRSSSAVALAGAAGHVCQSFERACSVALGGDTVIVEDGSYPQVRLDSCTGKTSTVTFETEPGHECPYSAATPQALLPAQGSDLSCRVSVANEISVHNQGYTGALATSPLANLKFVGIYTPQWYVIRAHAITLSHVGGTFFLIAASDTVTVADSDFGNTLNGDCSTVNNNALPGKDSTNIVIQRNIFHDSIRRQSSQGHPDGLFIQGMNGGLIDSNVFYRDAVLPLYLNSVAGGVIQNIVISNNVIHDLVDMTNTDSATHSVPQNTLSPQNLSLGDNTLSNVTVAFNSISGYIRRQDSAPGGGGGSGATSNLKVYGNVAEAFQYGNTAGACPPSSSIDYNAWFDNAGTCGAHDHLGSGTSPFTSDDIWTPAGSYYTVTPGDYTLRASTTPIGFVPTSFCTNNPGICPTLDFTGTNRPNPTHTTALNAGAYENR